MIKLDGVIRVSSSPITSILSGVIPNSSQVSRIAVSKACGSSGSFIPPGKQISPGWCWRVWERFSKRIQILPSRSTNGSKTAVFRDCSWPNMLALRFLKASILSANKIIPPLCACASYYSTFCYFCSNILPLILISHLAGKSLPFRYKKFQTRGYPKGRTRSFCLLLFPIFIPHNSKGLSWDGSVDIYQLNHHYDMLKYRYNDIRMFKGE